MVKQKRKVGSRTIPGSRFRMDSLRPASSCSRSASLTSPVPVHSVLRLCSRCSGRTAADGSASRRNRRRMTVLLALDTTPLQLRLTATAKETVHCLVVLADAYYESIVFVFKNHQ